MSSQRSDDSQGDTGTRDIIYDLISTSYHLLQGAETVAMYIADAEQQRDTEAADFFRRAKSTYSGLADEAKRLLAGRIGQEQGQAASGGAGGGGGTSGGGGGATGGGGGSQ